MTVVRSVQTRKDVVFALVTLVFIGIAIAVRETTTPPVPFAANERGVVGQTSTATQTAQVTLIIDGDTIELENGERVRYIGIDTPELARDGQLLECFGEESRRRNEELVLGKQVTLVRDASDRDRYGRLLRYVFVDDTFVNEVLVREGFAHAPSYPPNTTRQQALRQAERTARTNGSGLWSSCPD